MKHYASRVFFADASFPLFVGNVKQQSYMEPHDHDFIEIALVSCGSAIHCVYENGVRRSYGLVLGDVYSILPGEVHGYLHGRDFSLYTIAFLLEVVEKELPELRKLRSWSALLTPAEGGIRRKLHLYGENRIDAENALKRISCEMNLKREGWRFCAKLALLETLILISRSETAEWKVSANPRDTGVFYTISQMEANPAAVWRLDSLAQSARMSVSSYTRKFREQTGLSPLNYLTGLRLDKASRLLEETELSIAEIAFRCGLCDANYMTKLFRLRLGVTPDKYRKKLRF